MIPLSLDALQKLLETKQLKPQLQKDTNQLYVVFTFSGREFPLFFRIFVRGAAPANARFYSLRDQKKCLWRDRAPLALFK